jgi:hypothetical protein
MQSLGRWLGATCTFVVRALLVRAVWTAIRRAFLRR